MKKLLILTLILPFLVNGQNLPPLGGISGETVVIEATVNTDVTKNYLIVKSLTLTPKANGDPLVITSSSTNSWYAKIIETTDNMPPSMGENFVRTEVALEAFTDEYAFAGADYTDKRTAFRYSDGLGRPKQTVISEGSPSNFDIISHAEYAANGKMEKGFLPYIQSQTNPGAYRGAAATEQSTFYNGSNPLIPNDAKPYTFTETEASPLGRVQEQFGVGAVYQNNDKKMAYAYSIHNGATGAEVIRKWSISGGLPYAPNTSTYRYAANKVFISEVVNPEGIRAQTIVDSKGQKVASRIRKGTDWQTTYYVYDDFGQLRFMIPPLLDTDYSISQTEADNLCFQYEYDKYHRLIASKKPGAGWDYIVYDQWDRPVLSQNALQRTTNDWTFYKYDINNRLIMSGRYNTTSSHASLQTSAMADPDRYESTATNSYGYTTGTTFPSSFAEVYAMQYYDDHGFKSRIGINTTAYAFSNPSGFSNTQQTALKGMVTGSKIKILGTSSYLHTVIYYDQKYRMVQAVADNHLGGTDRVTLDMEWSGQVNKTRRDHSGAESVTIINTYDYDDTGRLINEWQQIDSQPSIMVASYRYNELGKMIEKNLHSTNGTSFLQSVDYRFDIRGALTSINNPNLNSDGTLNDDTGDLFGAKFHYTNAHTINGRSIPGRYDGNVSAFEWKNKNNETEPGFDKSIYGYEYDALNRLTRAEYATDNSGSWTGKGGHYTVNIDAYDDHGNITNLDRKAKGITIDDLTFVYPTNTNKLSGVTDAAPSGSKADGFDDYYTGTTDYTYDASGNLISDMNKQVTDMDYNHFNMVTKIEFYDGTRFTYQYDATGNRLNKTLTDADNNVVAKVDYVGGVEYLDDQIKQVAFSQGRAYEQQGDYHYEYFLTDHQGNTRVTFGDLPERSEYVATMETERADVEESMFSFPANLRTSSQNHTPGMNESVWLNGYNSVRRVGPAKVLTISSGDEVDMEVWAKYTSSSWNGATTSAIVAAVQTAFGVAGGGATSEGISAMGNTLSSPPAGSGLFGGASTNEPSAYLQWLFFDNAYNFVASKSGYIGVTDDCLNKFDELVAPHLTFTQAGYLYVYIANESNENKEVYFDDLKITHESPASSFKVTQVNDYYPFGMRMATSWDRDETTANNRLYNGGNERNHTTGLDETFFRLYDPALGRFHGVDPKAAKYAGMSPFNYAGSNPAMFNDPMGDDYYYDGSDWTYFNGANGGGEEMVGGGSRRQRVKNSLHGGGHGRQTVLGQGFSWTDQYFKLHPTAEYYMVKHAMSGSNGFYWHSSTPDQLYSFDNSATTLAFGMSYNNLHNSWGHTQFNRLGQDEVLFAARMAMDPMMDLRYAMAFQDPSAQNGESKANTYPTYATTYGISGSLAFIGGVFFDVGVIKGGGKWSFYASGGSAYGIDASIGAQMAHVYSSNPSIPFDIRDFQGFGAAHNVSLSIYDLMLGGDIDSSQPWGAFDPMQTYTHGGAGASFGLPLGYTYQVGYTELFGGNIK